ncbi:MAG: hypothetical protein UX46_C0009G0007 [Candidatus Amesbacteria bacterium GW2011_GWC1_46_24]|nr:MAG: hypothetical protein UX46_C0009G0007 [Candidatus Amesbacteria bacterium GW2011_GWC1_46_24]
MGGLVARSCLQSPGGENIGQLVTVGSPHAGASMAYKVWEGTDFSGMDDNLEKAIKLLSIIWRKKFDSKTQTLRAEVPLKMVPETGQFCWKVQPLQMSTMSVL